jgi:hypothetical protein
MKNLRTLEDLATKAQEISNNLSQFSGTEAYYRYSPLFPFMLLTDGTKYLSDACQCYWLLDIIASMQLDPLIKDHQELQTMQFWNLNGKRNKRFAIARFSAILIHRGTDEVSHPLWTTSYASL